MPRNSAYHATAAATSSAQKLIVLNPRRVTSVSSLVVVLRLLYAHLWNIQFLNVWQTERVLETSVRLLKLLSLLQVRRDWSGADLAGRLDVTTRTVRNDIERLRILGYEVRSSTGITGGYRLSAGS